MVFVILFGTVALLVAICAWGLRGHVCLRRKDCCGKGCGCLFPARRD